MEARISASTPSKAADLGFSEVLSTSIQILRTVERAQLSCEATLSSDTQSGQRFFNLQSD
jgi:hypothetical protein